MCFFKSLKFWGLAGNIFYSSRDIGLNDGEKTTPSEVLLTSSFTTDSIAFTIMDILSDDINMAANIFWAIAIPGCSIIIACDKHARLFAVSVTILSKQGPEKAKKAQKANTGDDVWSWELSLFAKHVEAPKNLSACTFCPKSGVVVQIWILISEKFTYCRLIFLPRIWSACCLVITVSGELSIRLQKLSWIILGIGLGTFNFPAFCTHQHSICIVARRISVSFNEWRMLCNFLSDG